MGNIGGNSKVGEEQTSFGLHGKYQRSQSVFHQFASERAVRQPAKWSIHCESHSAE